MSAADRREELEALIRSKTTYLDRLTGRYTAAVSETSMDAIMAAAEIYAREFARERLPVYVRLLGAEQLRATLRLAEAAEENKRADAGRARKRATS